jgi:hypothetical protein
MLNTNLSSPGCWNFARNGAFGERRPALGNTPRSRPECQGYDGQVALDPGCFGNSFRILSQHMRAVPCPPKMSAHFSHAGIIPWKWKIVSASLPLF